MAVLPTTNITTTLVSNALGENTHNVGNLCVSSKINMYSKYKPVRFPHETTDGYPNWWKGPGPTNQFASFSITTNIHPKTASQGTWIYNKPRGNKAPSGVIEPFRLADFRGYDHLATPVIYHTNYNINVDITNGNYVYLYCHILTDASGGGLDIMDFSGYSPDLPNCYFAVYVEGPSGTTPFVVTSIDKLTSITDGAEVIFTVDKEGTYTVYPCICNTKILQTDNWGNELGMYYALCPNNTYPTPIVVTVKESIKFPVSIEATHIAGGYTLNSANFYPVDNYLTGNSANKYFRTNSNIILKCNAINTTLTGNTIWLSSDIEIWFTDWDGNFKKLNGIIMYNSNKQIITSLTVQPNKTEVIYFFCPEAIMPSSGGTTPNVGDTWDSMFEIKIRTNKGWLVSYGTMIQVEYNSSI